MKTCVTPPLWTGTFLTFLFINLCMFLGFNMLLPTLPLYLELQGLTEAQIGAVFGSFMISAVTARLCAARLSVLFGALRTARMGIFVCAAGSFFYFLHDSIPSYVVARLLQGLGFGLTSTLLVSLASQTIPYSRMGEGIGYLGLGATAALAIGPYAGLYAAEEHGYVTLFVSVSMCCFAAVMVSFALPKIKLPLDRGRAECKASPGGETAAAGRDGTRPLARAEAAASVGAAPGPAPDGASPSQAPAARPSRVEWAAMPTAFLMLVYGVAISAVTTYLAVYASERGMPSAAEFFVVSTVGTVISRICIGRLYDRKGHKYVIPPAALAVFVAISSILSVPSRAVLDASAVLYGLGGGAIFPSLQTLSLTAVPPERRTVASAYFFVAFDIGMGGGSVIMGIVAGFFKTYRVVYVASLAALALFAACYLFIYRRGGPRGRNGGHPAAGRPPTPAHTPPAAAGLS
jgi:MFS family permease